MAEETSVSKTGELLSGPYEITWISGIQFLPGLDTDPDGFLGLDTSEVPHGCEEMNRNVHDVVLTCSRLSQGAPNGLH